MNPTKTIRVEYHLDQFWCDKYGMYFQGWIHCCEKRLKSLRITIGGDAAEVSQFTERKDLRDFFPDYPHVVDSGFQIYVPAAPGEHVYFTVNTDAGDKRFRLILPREEDRCHFEADGLPPSAAFRRFFESARNTRGTVVELGARSVAPGRSGLRDRFKNAEQFIGVDLYEDANVDVVADAHYLSRHIPIESVDILFSLSVIEHLQCPWLAAAEINRVLRVGGEVFINAPHSWPVHEAPNDFWRFSDEGLKVLFGSSLGFEVLESGLEDEMRMYPENRGGPLAGVPLNPGYCRAFMHARKVKGVNPDAVIWPLDGEGSSARSLKYPKGE
ncbi:MAG: methyltransferase domain-containing protein [Deltaproteobacteria bacterium]|nr:methyltransferase domain-containing protein [Deltaproteobacteria bacterium]